MEIRVVGEWELGDDAYKTEWTSESNDSLNIWRKIGRFTLEALEVPVKRIIYDDMFVESKFLESYELKASIAIFRDCKDLRGEEVEFARKSMGFTRGRLAESLGVTVHIVYKWERGNGIMPEEMRVKMLDLLLSNGGSK